MSAAQNFNVLTDPWIPLDDGSGTASYASYIDLMTGARDADDLIHARDDVRFFSRMLLSALTQALFGDLVPNGDALKREMASPMPRELVERRIAEFRKDFDLIPGRAKGALDLGHAGDDIAFLQGRARREKEPRDGDDEGVDSLLFDANKHQLYRAEAGVSTVCVESAVPLLYACQAFARKGGSGYFPGVRGAPPVTTLLVLPAVRASVWANVLHGQRRLDYPAERKRPWIQMALDATQPIGLVEGLFWQPLGARLSWADPGDTCAATGLPVADRGIQIRRLGGRMSAGATRYAHPYSPTFEEGMKRKFRHFSGRPAWTGLGDVLPGLRVEGKRRSRPAPVVEQWAELDAGDASLVLLDYVTKDASVTARFVQLFPLSAALRDERLADYASKRIEEACDVLHALRSRLYPGKKDKNRAFRARQGGREKASDVTAEFWQRTEPSFFQWLSMWIADVDGRDVCRDVFRKEVENIALNIFDDATAVLLGDPSSLARVVTQRRELKIDLRSAGVKSSAVLATAPAPVGRQV